MTTLAIVLAAIALIISLIAIILVLTARGGITRQGIRGGVKVTNDCDGNLASIPDQVRVKVELFDSQGQSSASTKTVPIGPDPSGNPIKNGAYATSVVWGPGFGQPEKWKIWVTKINGSNICDNISCPGASPPPCRDRIAKPIEVAYTSNAMTQDANVTCVCQ